MSTEREINKVGSTGGTQTATLTEADREKAHNDILKLTKAERRALIARVLDRGFVVDRAHVDNLPDNLYGEWVPKEALEIERKRAFGFWVDDKYAPNRSLHGDGSNAGMMGDCIFMVTSKEQKELIDEVRHEIYIKTHGAPDQVKRLNQLEEKTFKNQITKIDMPVIDEGKATRADETDIVDSLKDAIAADNIAAGGKTASAR